LLILARNIKYLGRILHLCLDNCSFPFVDIVHGAAEEAAVPDESYKSFEVLHIRSFIRNPRLYAGPPKAGSGPGKKNYQAPGKGGPAKNVCSKSEILSLSCIVTWAGSQRVNLCNIQIMILPRKAQGPLMDRQAPVICTGFLSLSSALLQKFSPAPSKYYCGHPHLRGTITTDTRLRHCWTPLRSKNKASYEGF
jgi:hypothetical protein